MTVSNDVQREIVSALLKNSYLFSICKDELNDGYFTDGASKIIYKALSVYYNKYNALPGLNELIIGIDECYVPMLGIDIADVKDICCKLYERPEADESFIKDKLTDFIRKVRSADALKVFIDKIKNNSNLESDTILSDLVNALDVQLSTSKLFQMNDINALKEARLNAIGSDDQSTVIPSYITSLNNALAFGGYQPGTVSMVVAPPGCFTGDTRILTTDGKNHTLEELYNSKEKYGIYGSKTNLTIKTGTYDSIYLSDYVNELMDVEIDNDYHIRCTLDHPFMMRDGSYKKAEDLKEYDELMPIKREYRVAGKGGKTLTDKSKGYECVVNGNGVFKYTHCLVASNIPHEKSKTQIHHLDCNKLNNSINNLTWMTTHEHLSYHMKKLLKENDEFRENSSATRIKKGEHKSVSTEFTSEKTRMQNLENWKDSEYREFMRTISVRNGKNSKMANELNFSKEFQDKTQRGKILSFINRLFVEFPNIELTEDNYDSFAENSKAKRKVWMKGIRKYFDMPWEELIKLAKEYNHKVTKITRITLEEKVPVYGIVNATPFGNYAVALDNEHGIFVHNTGKSMHLINEGVNAAKRGFEVLHILIGDLVEYDGFVRYLSCISSVDQNQLIRLTPEKQMELVKYYDQQYNGIFGRIQVLAYPSLSLTVDTLIEEINKFEKHSEKDFGMIIIDYPDNLLQDGKSLYEDGGTLYSSLERLARLTKSVLLVASQPGKMYWNHSIIPLEAAAESSKKQQAVDNMLTLNTEYRGAEFGSMLLAKARKGEVGKIFRFKTDFARCKIEEIDEATYNTYKASSTQPKSSGYNKQ